MQIMDEIEQVHAIEVLDSRGNPTIMTKVVFADGSTGVAKVPSGASTGAREALELRDGDNRYLGKGVTKAVENVNTVLAEAVKSADPLSFEGIDAAMLRADGTEDKSKLGANAILSVSMAAAVALAKDEGMELFEFLRTRVLGAGDGYLQPVPMSNVINGGEHAGNDLAIQEFMILPVSVPNIREAIRCISEIYHVLGSRMVSKYGQVAKNIGDEGGYCGFGLEKTTGAFDELMKAVEEAGYSPGKDVVFGIDAAASEFHEDGIYHIDGKELPPEELLEFYLDLEKSYPLESVEDPFDESSFEDFAAYTKESDVQVVTDDLTVSNPDIVSEAIDIEAGNSLLLKVNQIGTVTEAIQAARVANEAGWSVVVSHRSGETGDTFIADLAVALSTGQIKTGAPARSDRVAKYNRLLEIYDVLDGKCDYPGPDFRTAWRDYQ
ncbi:MAG: phosphopyruvate hydratase [Candidatus Thorarchaeota archaeon]